MCCHKRIALSQNGNRTLQAHHDVDRLHQNSCHPLTAFCCSCTVFSVPPVPPYLANLESLGWRFRSQIVVCHGTHATYKPSPLRTFGAARPLAYRSRPRALISCIFFIEYTQELSNPAALRRRRWSLWHAGRTVSRWGETASSRHGAFRGGRWSRLN